MAELTPFQYTLGILFALLLSIGFVWFLIAGLLGGPEERDFKRYCPTCDRLTRWKETTTYSDEDEVTVSAVCQRCKTGRSWIEVRDS